MHRVSSCALIVTAAALLAPLCAQPTPPSPAKTASAAASRDPGQIFAAGETALRAGQLDDAEHNFRQVLAIDPKAAGAYANLGVIHMRRKQWPQALADLKKAGQLAPSLAGIRLNIGLVYFRQNDFGRAIPPFESAVKQTPASFQARYLLGLCYFFSDRWTDAVHVLEPLWEQASGQLNYLYVLEHAADKSKNSALQERAAARLVEVGEGSPEFHLLIGKAHLNREEYDDAIKEFAAAAQGDAKLPFVHFNLGLAYTHKQDYDRARAEFQQDIALHPDVPFSYEKLGGVEATLGNEEAAADNFRAALKINPGMIPSLMGLARIDERQRRYSAALSGLNEVIRFDTENAGARYLRGQVLVRMGREKEGRAELATATKMLNDQRAARHKELEGDSSPELAQEPK